MALKYKIGDTFKGISRNGFICRIVKILENRYYKTILVRDYLIYKKGMIWHNKVTEDELTIDYKKINGNNNRNILWL